MQKVIGFMFSKLVKIFMVLFSRQIHHQSQG